MGRKVGSAVVGVPNFPNRSIYIGDNLHVMRGMNDACVDLIYLDPPFNSNRNYSAPIGSESAGAAFKDAWTKSDLDDAWAGNIAEEYPAVYSVCKMAEQAHSDGMYSYLVMMARRLMEMHRILKPTGSIWLHCDPTASHYLKLVMDSILGKDNFRNEVIWKRTSSKSAGRKLGAVHDVLLWYAGGDEHIYNKVYGAHDPRYVEKFYRYEDAHGRYRTGDLTAAGVSNGDSGQPWRGINPSVIGRHWGVPGTFPEHVAKPGDWENMDTRAKLDYLDANGLVHWPQKQGGVPAFKRYLSTSKGVILTDVMTDIPPLSARSKEKTGYPTQKPLALLERIIKASSNEGDVVLDPFCGCATTCEAAERLGRQWVGIDLSRKAYDLIRMRLERAVDKGALFKGRLPKLHHFENTTPSQTDHSGKMSRKDAKPILFGREKGKCKKCQYDYPYQMFDVDHVIPKAHGGQDVLENYQLLCVGCHRYKGTLSDEEHTAKLKKMKIIK